MIHRVAHPRRLACLTICTAVLSYASSCHSTEPRIVFGAEDRTISIGPLTAPSTAPLRALRHPGATTRIAMGGLELGLTLLDPAGDMVEMFEGENVVEIDRDPAEPELLVVFLEEGSRFEILRNGAATTRPSSRYVRDFLLADHDGNGSTDLIGLSEGGEVFVVPSYAEVMDFDAVATPIGTVGAVREQPGTDRPRRIDVGDFDGDGGADVVIGVGDQGVVIILSSGEEMTSVAVSAASVIRAELDGEPGDEIVTYGDRRYDALRWNDEGLVVYGGESEKADGIDVADLTGDGRDDVLLLFSDSGPVMLAAATDDGLAPLRPVDISGAADATSFAAGDFDGDGSAELALLRFSPTQGCHSFRTGP